MQQSVRTYGASWRSYRRWYIASLGLFILFLPTFAMAAQRYPSLMQRDVVIIPAFFLGYAALWMAVTTVARRWKWPRCGRYFFLRDVMQTQWPMGLCDPGALAARQSMPAKIPTCEPTSAEADRGVPMYPLLTAMRDTIGSHAASATLR